MSTTDFKTLLDEIYQKYQDLEKENSALKAQIQSLKAENKNLKKQITKYGKRSETPTKTIPRSPQQQASDKPLGLSKKPSIPFWQSKTKIKVDWTPIPIDFSDSLLCVHKSKDGILSFGSVDSTITLYSTENGQKIGTVPGHKGAINCIVSDPVTGLFASCSGDGNINIWSPQQSSPFQSLRRSSFDQDPVITANTILSHHTGPVFCATWINNDGHLISGSQDNTLCLWDVTHSASCIKTEEMKSSVLSIDLVISLILS